MWQAQVFIVILMRRVQRQPSSFGHRNKVRERGPVLLLLLGTVKERRKRFILCNGTCGGVAKPVLGQFHDKTILSQLKTGVLLKS